MNKKRLILWLVIGLIVFGSLYNTFKPRSLEVDLVKIEPGPMLLTVGDEGKTRVKNVFVVSAPVTGTLRRVNAVSGDLVVANETLIAELEPSEADPLDPRSEAEAEAQLSAAVSAESLARAELAKAEADLQFAASELKRARELVKKGTIAEREMEVSERAHKTSQATVGIAQASLQVRKYELDQARAHLMSPQEMASRRISCACVSVISPIDGQVLQVLRKSEGLVRAGESIVEIGNPEQLEIVVDLLSTDAVKVKAGQEALIENWGGDHVLKAMVRRVEPFGFTKVSALGIEEQRVNIVLDLVSLPAEWAQLGHGYQVDVRILLWHGDNVLSAPLTSLFRDGDEWATFVNKAGKAVKRHVRLGHKNDNEAQIISGIEAGDILVLYPSEGIEEGVRITAR